VLEEKTVAGWREKKEKRELRFCAREGGEGEGERRRGAG
jgi:hypothetical protein